MSVSRRGRFLAVRWALGLGALAAFPFLASGVAQAAMAGANPLTTTNRPDLRTVHTSSAFQTGEFCFDKTIANTGPGLSVLDPDRFAVGGYRFDTNMTATGGSVNVESSNTQCAVATFPVAVDMASYSFGSVADNSVIANAGGGGAPGNIGDSTANLDSNSHNGTVDHTTAPDLQAVAVDTTNNRLNYVFDQPVDTKTVSLAPSPADLRFVFYDSNGNPHWGVPVGASGTVVSVQFNSGTDSVSTAQQAVVIRGGSHTEGQPQGNNKNCTNGTPPGNGAVCENGGNPETMAPTESVAVPGNSGLTARPTLQSAALVPGPSNQIDYTFSVPISAGAASDLVAVTSRGTEVTATSETIIATNTVRATFATLPNGLQNFQEEIVKASAYGCAPLSSGCADTTNGFGAVQSVNKPAGAQTRFNLTGGVGVGDNAGAFATGFSDGPDARSVTFNNSTGTVTVQMDQRVDPNTLNVGACGPGGNLIGGGCWVLLDGTGAVVDPTPSSGAVVNNSPFQSQVVLTYPPSDLQRATALAIAGTPFVTAPGGDFTDTSAAAFTYNGGEYSPADGTVRQIISPTASGNAFLDPAMRTHHYRWHRHHRHHRSKR